MQLLLPILVAIALGLLALAFVLSPFYRRAPASPKTAREDAIHGSVDTTEREDAARSALREIELDYHLGNIEEADYRNLRERYMHRAIAALKSRYEHGHDLTQDADANDHTE